MALPQNVKQVSTHKNKYNYAVYKSKFLEIKNVCFKAL